MDDIARLRSLELADDLSADEIAEVQRIMMQRCAIDPDNCPIPLWPGQAIALAHAQATGGLLGVLGVGFGKSLVSFLLPTVLGAKNPLLIIPASLRGKTIREADEYRKHYHIMPINIMSYTQLSQDKDADGVSRILDRIAPDVIIMDESHKAINLRAGCVRKLTKYIIANDVKVCALSGTMYRSSLMDVHHIMLWTLRDKMPLPMLPGTARTWASAIDPGALGEDERLDAAQRGGIYDIGIHGDDPIDIVSTRIRSSYGVVTGSSDHDGPLEIDLVDVPPSPITAGMVDLVRAGTSPTGDPLLGQFDKWQYCQTLAAGFYNVWNPAPPAGWRRKRSAWKRFAGEMIDAGVAETEEGVARAVDYGRLPDGVQRLAAWRKAREEFSPNSVPVWIDEDAPILHYAAQWLQQGPGRLCWVADLPVGQRIAALAGVACYGAGQGIGGAPMVEDADGASCVVTIAANGAGRNLQKWNRNLFLTVPSKARDWDQCIGRTHRPGQTSTVYVTVCACTPEHRKALDAVMPNAEFVAAMTGEIPKILSADGAL